MKRIVSLLLVALTLIGILSTTFVAYAINEQDTGSLTISYVDEGTKIADDKLIKNPICLEGAEFSIALVATEGNGQFEWVRALEIDQGFAYKTSDLYTSRMEAITEILVNKAESKLDILKRTTGRDGQCTFMDIPCGIYVVWQSGKSGVSAKYTETTPFLVEIPDRTGEEYDYDVVVTPKPAILTVKLVSVTGTKSWEGEAKYAAEHKDDEDYVAIKRPESITLRLFANGKEVGCTTTSEKMGWAFSFDGVNSLDENGEQVKFTIKEDKVEGYTFKQGYANWGENTVVINVKNVRGENAAKTGDETQVWLWIAIMGACVIVVILLIVPKKKKQAKKSLAEKAVEKANKEANE